MKHEQVPDRRAARHQATKARIVGAAWALAREEGLAGISLRELAKRVDLRGHVLRARRLERRDTIAGADQPGVTGGTPIGFG